MTAAQLTERLSRLAPGAPLDALGLEARELLRTVQNAEEYGFPIDDSQLEVKIDSAIYRLKTAAQDEQVAKQYETP